MRIHVCSQTNCKISICLWQQSWPQRRDLYSWGATSYVLHTMSSLSISRLVVQPMSCSCVVRDTAASSKLPSNNSAYVESSGPDPSLSYVYLNCRHWVRHFAQTVCSLCEVCEECYSSTWFRSEVVIHWTCKYICLPDWLLTRARQSRMPQVICSLCDQLRA